VILVELLAGSAALAPWLGDRAALLRGDARWSGTLPPAVERHVNRRSGARAGELRALIASLLAVEAATRPTATAAAAALATF